MRAGEISLITAYGTYSSPVGEITVEATGAGLSLVRIGTGAKQKGSGAGAKFSNDSPYFSKLFKLFDKYFSGKEVDFDIPLDTGGSEFQCRLWVALRRVPYGTVVTYGELARMARSSGAARAAGGACGANPVPIVIPCHRVVPASGGVGCYSAGPSARAGVKIKRALLSLEGLNPVR